MLITASVIFCNSLNAQVPQGFNYQAIARDATGNPITGATIKVKLSILSDTTGFYATGSGVYIWEEEHVNVKTNAFGLFTLTFGNPLAAKIQGSAPSFNSIPWVPGPVYMGVKVANPTIFKQMGSAKLWSVPYALVASSVSGTLGRLAITSTTPSLDEALFEVKNNTGQTIFAVYNEGIRAYVDNGAKGSKGGFAIGGFGTAKAPSQPFMMITPDSARIYVNESLAKGSRGGFAVGGFTPGKGTTSEFMYMSPDNYFIGHSSGQSVTTGVYNSTLGYYSGHSLTSGSSNVFVGYQSGYSTNTGSSNIFIGTTSGYYNTSGYWNIMLGRATGQYNTTGYANIAIGDYAGNKNTIGFDNVMVGDYAGGNNTTGSQNVFMGASAGLRNVSGQKNTYIGFNAGYSGASASGSNNIFIGAEAGYNNTTGFDNIAVGNLAGRSNVDGTYNVMIGPSAGRLNVSGNYNTMLGYKAGESQAGNYATLIGYNAGNSTTSGNSQTMVGYEAGRYNNGSFNTFLGVLAGGSSGTGNFNTYLGLAAGREAAGSYNVFIGKWAGWYETGSNKLIIESSDYSGNDNYNNALVYGDFASKYLKVNGNFSANDQTASNDNPGVLGLHNVTQNWGIGVKGLGGYIGVSGESTLAGGSGYRIGVYGYASGGASNYAGYFNGNVYVNGTVTETSDRSLKKNILPISGSLEKVLELKGVTYEWKSQEELSLFNSGKGELKKEIDLQRFDFPKGIQLGVIAQDVEKVAPELVHTDANGIKSVDYIKIIPLLIEAIKDQQNIIESQSRKITELEGAVKQLMNN